ncbi:MAG: trypsin-like peptidase domain-containing protein, partial [Planctomycetaceae bacterium]|nr:trypsin-like peptidase domain-containing protein [Planctomycetaceae bacterium]
QHPERLRHPSEVFPISRTQFPPSVDHLVVRKEIGVFRVESVSDQNWTVRGSAFAISFVRDKLYLVTSASVLESDEGLSRSKERFRIQASGTLMSLALWLQPTQLLFHPQRKNGVGPDVAIIEVNWNPKHPPPTMFNLRSPDETTDLRNRECAFLAYPNRQDASSLGPPEYASGHIAADYDAKQNRLSYRADYPYQADGAPLFVIDDQSGSGQALRESVVGITSSSRFGDNQRQAESVDLIWQIIFNATPQLGFPILPDRKSRAELKETGLVVRVPPETPATQEQTPPQINWHERIDRALRLAAQEGHRGNWDQGFAHLTDIEAQLSQEGMSVVLPWEFYTLRGVLLTHRGFQQNENNNRKAAIQSFSAAWEDCNRGRLMAPGELYPRLMVGRIYNNLGTPNPGQPIGAQERTYLKWTHDQMEKLVKDDQSGIRPLEPKHLAQCQYLLGYVHQVVGAQPVVGGKLCNAADGRGNFQKSWAALHSKQVAHMLQIQSPDSVDIW